MAYFNKKTQDQADSISTMEAQLRNGLNPVQPDPEFVSRLRYRLANPPDVYIEYRRKLPVILIVLAYLSSGLIILWILNKVRRSIVC
jgi:hypothetical protein